jgi:hypothetical protein
MSSSDLLNLFAGTTAGAIFSIALYLFTRERKILDWSLLVRQPVLGLLGKHPSVTVMVDGTHVHDPHVVIIEVINAGNRELTSSDFHSPITIRCHESRILSADVSGTSHPSMLAGDPKVSDGGRTLNITPSLLNRYGRFSLTLLMEGGGPVGLSTLIAGQTRGMIESSDTTHPASRYVNAVVGLTFAIPLLMFFVALLLLSLVTRQFSWWVFVGLLVTAVVVVRNVITLNSLRTARSVESDPR